MNRTDHKEPTTTWTNGVIEARSIRSCIVTCLNQDHVLGSASRNEIGNTSVEGAIDDDYHRHTSFVGVISFTGTSPLSNEFVGRKPRGAKSRL